MDRAMGNAFGSRYIRNDDQSSAMTDRTYKKLVQQVYESLDSQGCFDSVWEKIALAVQEAEGEKSHGEISPAANNSADAQGVEGCHNIGILVNRWYTYLWRKCWRHYYEVTCRV